jgi:TonB family protein
MKQVLALLTLVVAPVLSLGQDIRVREEAVHLLEKANAVSTAVKLPNLERTDTFRVIGSDPAVKEGTFTRVVIQGTGRREETTFGDYHVIDIITDKGVTTVRTRELAPPEVRILMRLTPIYRVYFDHQDVIHEIANREVNSHPSRCIEFDTVAGQKTQANEICVDAGTGAIVRQKLGDELIENSEFFSFAGALLPGRINYSFAGVPKMEIRQVMSPLTDGTANVLAAPPDAQVRQFCKTYRRPFGESMPQPKPGNGGSDAEIVVRGMIGGDGRIHDAVVQSSERPDLNAEALDVIHQWVFTPALCNGQPNLTEASFTLHFQGR